MVRKNGSRENETPSEFVCQIAFNGDLPGSQRRKLALNL
jgi:hypothetical protein